MDGQPTLDKIVDAELEKIKITYAVGGLTMETEISLRHLLTYAHQQGGDISKEGNIYKRITEIRKISLDAALHYDWSCLEGYADEGNGRAMQSLIPRFMSIYRAAQSLGITLEKDPQGIDQILKRGYERAIPQELKSAEEYARAGKMDQRDISLRFAQIYASALNTDVSAQVKSIKALKPTN